MANAQIQNYNGTPTIFVDGKPYGPMMATIRTCLNGGRVLDEEYYRNLGKSGIKFFFVICDTQWAVPDGFQQFRQEAETILRAVPDAYLFLRVGMHPSAEWVAENPDETMTYSDGLKKPASLYTESLQQQYPAMYSLSSQKWREEASKHLLELYDKVEALPFADRIVGYFFAAGGTSEWYYLTPTEYTPKTRYLDTGGFEQTADTDYDNVYADLSPAFRREFSLYLRTKYKTDEALRRAWKDDTVTLENPRIPDCEKRYYVNGIDYDIDHPPKMLSTSDKPEGPSNGTNIGHFIDLEKHRDVFDFYQALHQGTANSVIHFGKVIKERSGGNKLTGAFYGSAGSVKFFSFGQVTGTRSILDSGAIDFLASPSVYENRQPGGFAGQRQVFDSYAIRNRIFIVEDDARTHHENAYYRNYFELYTIEDTYGVLKRDFGRNLCQNTQGWWFDQLIGGGRYKDPDIYKLFARQQEIAAASLEQDRRKNSQIAFIYDEESFHVISEESSHQMVELLRNYEIDKIGAPADRYYHNDMADPAMPDYKLYIFANTLYLNDAERETIRKKLRKNRATALFLYGSGVINPDREPIFSPDHITELTGIHMEQNNDVVSGKFKFTPQGTALSEGVDRGDSHGDFKRKMWANASSYMNRIKTSRVNLYPEFYAREEDALCAARLLETGHPALSVKEAEGFTSIYCASKYLGADVLRAIARFAGCHIYTDSEDVLYANRHYVVLHAASSGEKTVCLPQKASAWEVYEEKLYSRESNVIQFSMTRGETKMFELR